VRVDIVRTALLVAGEREATLQCGSRGRQRDAAVGSTQPCGCTLRAGNVIRNAAMFTVSRYSRASCPGGTRNARSSA